MPKNWCLSNTGAFTVLIFIRCSVRRLVIQRLTGAGTPSSCLPPWADTMIPSAPASTACLAARSARCTKIYVYMGVLLNPGTVTGGYISQSKPQVLVFLRQWVFCLPHHLKHQLLQIIMVLPVNMPLQTTGSDVILLTHLMTSQVRLASYWISQ